jgi:hypothetical protein
MGLAHTCVAYYLEEIKVIRDISYGSFNPLNCARVLILWVNIDVYKNILACLTKQFIRKVSVEQSLQFRIDKGALRFY